MMTVDAVVEFVRVVLCAGKKEDSPVNVHVTCTVGRRRSDFLLRGGNLYPFSPQMRQEQNEADETARCSRHNRKQEHCQMLNVENDEEVMDAAKARHHSTGYCRSHAKEKETAKPKEKKRDCQTICKWDECEKYTQFSKKGILSQTL
eukprot:scaffold2215_cov191-Alexandrium_tamarense.AAC.8